MKNSAHDWIQSLPKEASPVWDQTREAKVFDQLMHKHTTRTRMSMYIRLGLVAASTCAFALLSIQIRYVKSSHDLNRNSDQNRSQIYGIQPTHDAFVLNDATCSDAGSEAMP